MSHKLKSINRKERKGYTQRSQRAKYQGFDFATFAPSLITLRLKLIYKTAPV